MEITPQFTVTEGIFEAAAAGIAAHAPDVGPLEWERFTAPGGWLLILDDQGELSKAEMSLLVTAERTVRLSVCVRPDLRGGQKPMPYNHPWSSFTGHVLLGGYAEDRHAQDGGRSALKPRGPA
ncbi:hypothetical protein [Streptomyces sp. 35G-GA-8]|uniref:hypothetical protein n=1 Tax=Streptomyces sp. 35G-GA-8 TaxID=2939434 RepID=UPI00201F39E8|nr:hypothetical protein [Streptomyces sp. 35G-GA-8]MCL7377012.1 hypothetical protein [Streptomyces sp. 35G-GA-8]